MLGMISEKPSSLGNRLLEQNTQYGTIKLSSMYYAWIMTSATGDGQSVYCLANVGAQ